MKKPLYIVKIGGSLIIEHKKPYRIRYGEIKRTLSEIAAAKKKKGFDLIIFHGSGALSAIPSLEYKAHKGLKGEDSKYGCILAERAANRVDDQVMKVGLQLRMNLFSFSPHDFATTKRGIIDNIFVDHIKMALKYDFIPLSYGDMLFDSKQGFSDLSSEEVMLALAKKLDADKIVSFTDLDGVFTKDPKLHRDAKLVRKVNRKNIGEVISQAGPSLKLDTTGGMRSKVSSIYNAVERSRRVGYIVNGQRRGRIFDMLIGKEVECTEIRY